MAKFFSLNWNRLKPWILPVLVCIMVVKSVRELQLVNTEIEAHIQRRDDLIKSHSSAPRNACITQSPLRVPLKAGVDIREFYCNEECLRKREMKRNVDCVGLMEGDKNAQEIAKQYLTYHGKLFYTDTMLAAATKNCTEYLSKTYYPVRPLSQTESDFPIAYSIVSHRDAFQLERLLQAIYWPQNWYCIHIDNKSKGRIASFVSNLVKCLPNVIIPHQRESVIYGGISRLKADINCMEELLKHNRTWKYVINLTGQEFPLRTNTEIVKILKIYNGANDIEGVSKFTTTLFNERYGFHWALDSKGALKKDRSTKKDPPPANITLIKGSAFGVFSRGFVEVVLRNALAQEFLTWLSDTWSPDEVFWSTLNSKLYNPMFNAPGSYDAVPERKTWLAKYAAWPPYDPCHGKNVHGVCVFSYLDLPNLISRKHLFANKFQTEFDYLVLDCLEQWLHNKTYHQVMPLEYDVYLNLPFIIK